MRFAFVPGSLDHPAKTKALAAEQRKAEDSDRQIRLGMGGDAGRDDDDDDDQPGER